MRISERKPKRRFTPEEDAMIAKVVAAGLSPAAASEKLARKMKHTPLSIMGRIYWLRLSAEKKAAKAAKVCARRRGEYRSHLIINAVCQLEIPSDVLDDRERRMLAPRSITAFVLGDPPPGYSALDRKQSGDARGV
jgi:hypothetical protein